LTGNDDATVRNLVLRERREPSCLWRRLDREGGSNLQLVHGPYQNWYLDYHPFTRSPGGQVTRESQSLLLIQGLDESPRWEIHTGPEGTAIHARGRNFKNFHLGIRAGVEIREESLCEAEVPENAYERELIPVD
jgi:hypothetical protein